MKKLSFIFFLLPILSCEDPTNYPSSNGKEFEGVVTYRITYDGYPKEYGYGDTLKLWYSKGNLVKQYNGNAEHGIRKEVFFQKGNRYFVQLNNSDTLLTIDPTTDKYMTLNDSHHSITDTRILGHVCEEIDQQLEYTANHVKASASLLYSKEVLPIDKDHFKNIKISCFDRFIDESGAFYLRYKFGIDADGKNRPSSYTFTAINILERPVDSSVFNIDTSRVKSFSF